MSESKFEEIEETSIKVLGTGNISPHNKAIYEAGKNLLIESINTGREFCQFMIKTTIGAIPIYLGILSFLLPEKYSLGVQRGFIIAFPALIFLVASIVFTIGYLPVTSQFSLDIIDEIEQERNKAIRRRKKLIGVGFALFVLASLIAIAVIVINIGAR